MMSPAFSSTRQAAVFALFLLLLLLSPLIVGKRGLPPKEQSYATLGWGSAPMPYMREQIFEEKGDIDIAFIGSSHMMHGIDTPYVQKELSKKLGRPAVVRSIAWGGAGFDALTLFTHDLLEHRKVGMIVFYDENDIHGPNGYTPGWFRYGEDAHFLEGLPLEKKAMYYFASIVGMPRQLLSWLRPNIPAELVSSKKNYCEDFYFAENPATRLGSVAAKRGYNPDRFALSFSEFVPFAPQTNASPEDVVIYSPETKSQFEFKGPPTPAWKLNFAKQFAKVVRSHGTRLTMLYLPVMKDIGNKTIVESEYWPDSLGVDMTMVGISPEKLFSGLSKDQIFLLFGDEIHFNKNGQEYFTRLVAPQLVNIYLTKH